MPTILEGVDTATGAAVAYTPQQPLLLDAESAVLVVPSLTTTRGVVSLSLR